MKTHTVPGIFIEDAIRDSITARAKLHAEAEAVAAAAAMEAAAAELESAIEYSQQDQEYRYVLEQDICRYERHCAFVMEGLPDSTALWKATAAKAARVPVASIELRAIDQKAPITGRVVEILPSSIRFANARGDYLIPSHGVRLVTEGEDVVVGQPVTKSNGATHAIVKGSRIDANVIGFANVKNKEVVAVLVEGRNSNGYFTLLASGLKPEFRFHSSITGIDRLERLIGGYSLALAAPLPGSDLRAAADAMYGPYRN